VHIAMERFCTYEWLPRIKYQSAITCCLPMACSVDILLTLISTVPRYAYKQHNFHPKYRQIYICYSGLHFLFGATKCRFPNCTNCIKQLPTDTFKKTYAYRSNSSSRIMFYKPAIFVIVNLKTFLFFKTLFLSHYNS